MYKVYKNTIKISKACAKELYETQQEFWMDENDVIDYKGKLNITSDNILEIDCLDIFEVNKLLLPILQKHKVSGEINAGYIVTTDYEEDIFWGYIFDKGIVTKLSGELTFKVEE